MRRSTEQPGTEQDFAIWVDSDVLLSAKIVDQDGTAVDLTDCSLKMLIKQDRDDADGDAVATATVETAVAASGTITMDIAREALDPNITYYYDLKVLFPVDYTTTRLQSKQLLALWGKLPARQEITRDATAEE